MMTRITVGALALALCVSMALDVDAKKKRRRKKRPHKKIAKVLHVGDLAPTASGTTAFGESFRSERYFGQDASLPVS
ncbi:MAG: hypothetical protein AAF658_15160, partial [Myxococcota bacterium]